MALASPFLCFGKLLLLALPLCSETFSYFFQRKISVNSLAAISSASVFSNLHFMGGSLKPHFLLFSDSPQPSSRQLLRLLNTFSSWPSRRKCTAKRQGQNPAASFLLIRQNQFSSQVPRESPLMKSTNQSQEKAGGGRNLHRNSIWCAQVWSVPRARGPLFLGFRGTSSPTTCWGSLHFLLPKRSRQTHTW